MENGEEIGTIDGPLRIVGINEKGEEHKVLVQGYGLANAQKVWEYDAVIQSQFPSSMEFPALGLWKLEVYLAEELFGEIVVELIEGNE